MDENEEETTVEEETTDDVNPDVESAKGFADDVASKVALVESGEMTLDEFVAGCTETLQAISAPDTGALGGLGGDAGEFADLGEEDETV